jgi:hypothetical protein
MTKGIKIALIVSIILNACLIIGFIYYRNFVKYKSYKQAAMTSQIELKLLETISSELESNDPDKITALKEWLQKNIELGKKNVEIRQQAADNVK